MAHEDIMALLDHYHNEGGLWPYCHVPMRVHSYRENRYTKCTDPRCLFADGRYCGCTCEGTFHGINNYHRAWTTPQYIY
jgi:hypothetical protein